MREGAPLVVEPASRARLACCVALLACAGCASPEPAPGGAHTQPAPAGASSPAGARDAGPSATAADAGPKPSSAGSHSVGTSGAGSGAAGDDSPTPAGSAAIPPPPLGAWTCDGGAALSPGDFPEGFVFDVATHAIAGETSVPARPFAIGIHEGLPWVELPEACSGTQCRDRAAYIDAVLTRSDTTYAVLTGVPYTLGPSGMGTEGLAVLVNDDLLDMGESLERILGSRRVFVAPAVMPNDRLDLQLQAMERAASFASAWLTDTSWSPDAGGGYFLDDDAGSAMIRGGVDLGVSVFLLRKGRTWAGSPEHGSPRDVGAVARTFADARFVVLQAAFEQGFAASESSRPSSDATLDQGWGPGVGTWPEGPYDAESGAVQAQYPLDRGVNSLITSLREHGIEPNQNVYASLDGVWAELITRPIEAAHVLGKLLQHIGEDNVLWGTQSLLYGGAQPQIEAFRDFEIPVELQQRYGYPALTADRKDKILGRNAARLFCLTP